jgi:hypothetical protein
MKYEKKYCTGYLTKINLSIRFLIELFHLVLYSSKYHILGTSTNTKLPRELNSFKVLLNLSGLNSRCCHEYNYDGIDSWSLDPRLIIRYCFAPESYHQFYFLISFIAFVIQIEKFISMSINAAIGYWAHSSLAKL